MTTLCEVCFPDWEQHEVLTMVPLTPCAQCRCYAPSRHVFRVDPRAGGRQHAIVAARARGELGAERAADRAGDSWKIAAVAAVEAYCIAHPGETFMAEQIREWAALVPPPPDGRAWGQVMQAAKRAGIIEAAGYAPAVSSNGSPKVLWRRA